MVKSVDGSFRDRIQVGSATDGSQALHSAGCALPLARHVELRASVYNEAAVRQMLRNELLSGSERHAEVVYELWVPQSYERADLALIGKTFAGYEIKTQRDTLKRLPRQVAAYGRMFDRCTVVVAERHVPESIKLVPDWWGVLVIADEGAEPFKQVRVAQVNCDVDPHTIVRLLWKDEVRSALSVLGDPPADHARRHVMWEQLLRLVDLDALKTIVRQALVVRQQHRAPTRLEATQPRRLAEISG